MEAVEKDFQDLVTSEEEPTTAVTTDVEDEIIQQILTSEDEVEETAKVEETKDLEEEGILDDDEIESLSDEEGWEDVSEDDLAKMEKVLAELKAEKPDIDVDEVDIVINEDGEIEIYQEARDPVAAAKLRKYRLTGKGKKADKEYEKKSSKGGYKKSKARSKGQRKSKYNSHDPSEVAADDAVAIGEEEQDVHEYTAWRTVGGELKKVKRWDSKGIEEGPKPSAPKAAISKAMKRSNAVKKAHGDGEAEESFNPTEVITALSTGEELSEAFKEKASVIFESAVNNEVEKHLELAEVEVQKVFEEEFDTAVGGLTSKVDSYLDYVVEEWIKENEVAIESGIRSEIAENFIGGLKTLFTQNYIDVPDTKVDVVEQLGQKVKELEGKLNTELTSNIALKQELSEHKRDEVIQSLSSELTVAEVEKLKELAEGVSFEDSSDFADKITTLKENYFPTAITPSGQEELLTEETDFETLSSSMDAYTKVLTSTVQS